MPRNFYETIVGAPDLGGSLKVYPAMRITVLQRGTAVLASIYQRETGSTQGPSPEAGASGGPNPFATGATGSVQFWADIGRYDILIEDTQAPARIGSRTIQWNSVPLDQIPGANLADLGVTTGKLAELAVTTGKLAELAVSAAKQGDSSVQVRALAAEMFDLFVPIGAMVDYGGTVDPPQTAVSRWVITDGRPFNQTNYATLFARLGNAWDTFDGQAAPGAGLFRIPKSGPRVSVPAGSGTGLTTRVRGDAGGKERHRLSGEESGVPAHGHGTSDPGHQHGITGYPDISGGILAVTNLANGAVPFAAMTQIAGTGVTVTPAAAAPATNDHENMQPWVCLGPKIIRIA